MENKDVKEYFIQTTSDKLDEVKTNYPEALFYHIHDEKNGEVVNDNLYVGDCKVTDRFNIGDMDENIKTSKLGGLESTDLKSLKEKSVSQILMDILCPVIPPTKSSSPSMSLVYDGDTIITTGTNLPNKSDIVITYNNGKWSDGSNVAGSHYNGGLIMDPNSWEKPSEDGVYTISGSCSFTEGDIPKDNHGTSYADKQYKGGTVKSNKIQITSVHPIYINNTTIDEMTPIELLDYINGVTFLAGIPAETDDELNKFRIYLPYEFSTFEVKQYNPLTDKYDIDVNMELMEGETSKYIRTKDVKNTNTSFVKYEIKLKK